MSQGVHMLDSRIAICSKYWSRFIYHEESLLASLRWYINVVFDREGVFCQGTDVKVQNLQQQHVMIKAIRIFNLCYCADKYTSFVVTNHQKNVK